MIAEKQRKSLFLLKGCFQENFFFQQSHEDLDGM